MNRVKANDGEERLDIVNVICLGEAKSNHTSLMTCYGTIRMIFVCEEDPLARDNIGIYQMRNQGKSPTRNQGLHLQVHHRFPCKYMCRLNIQSWNGHRGYCRGKGMKRGRKSIIEKKIEKWEDEDKNMYPCEG